MRGILSFVLAVFLVLIASSASAQSGPRGFVQGLGGVTFGTETSSVYGGGFGVNIHPNIQLTGEFGYMKNVLPKYVQDAADSAASDVESLILYWFGERIDVSVDAKAPSFYGMGGVRMASASGNVRPYVEAGGGFARVSPEVHLKVNGDDLTTEIIQAGYFEQPGDVSKFLMAFGGGVSLGMVKGFAVDIGYRYTRIFAEEGINVSRAHFAIGYAF